MTDFGLEGFDPRRERSERVFWVYVIASVLVHAALVAWLVTADFNLPTTTPAILVRLINPGAEAGGGGGPAGGGGGPAPMAATAAPAAPAPSAATPAAPTLPAVSPVKEETAPAETASAPEAPVPAVMASPSAEGIDGSAVGGLPSGPGGPGDGSGGPGGSGSGPGGPGGGGGDGDGPAGLPASYLNAVRSRIMRNRHYPEVCRDNHIEGTVRVRVTINPDGQVTETRLAHSSGSEELDRAGVAAIEKTSFPPFPPGLDLPPQRITVPVNFSLND